ncbi:PAS domain-containing sensor histidine kinase [Cellulophaga sp. HaHaR_3_176]|uniref:PAS domain-containing sensor histidine kinase n=1 Tax=Cellulophaga sp. HaHaR_3_176 TaxID=1942464 RepID=UPI001C1FE50B|nr:PAS domain-containing sensor histidine kinase [Cellulophaga sp. HaHaR_3_176]QWX82897.1 PAS domain-containing sensor histidine kinase [Cellulophaga sp. HaHaR_3_176]
MNLNLELKPFFETSLDFLCIAGFDGYFKKLNPSFVNLLQYSEDVLYATQIIDLVHVDDKHLMLSSLKSLSENIPIVNLESRYVSKTGEIIWLHWNAIPLVEENLMYVTAKDISHEKKIEEERRNYLLTLDKKNQELKTLNFKTSHDLRSPINNLLTLCNLLDATKLVDPQMIQIVNLIKKSSNNLKKSLDTYIDEIEKDVVETRLEKVGFASSLKKVQTSIFALIQDSKIEFEVDFSELKSISFNRSYLESIFLNLITNSIKYSKPGVNPKVTIKTKIEENIKKLIFTDNGLGFNMDLVGEKIFNLHQKFHNNNDSKGVGLYLVNSHITNLGGTITVDSQINKGATFTIAFKS